MVLILLYEGVVDFYVWRNKMMNRSASEIIRNLQVRIARLERQAMVADPLMVLNSKLGNAKVEKVLKEKNIPGGTEFVVKLLLWKSVGLYEPIQTFRVMDDGQVLGYDEEFGWEEY
jgi:hypothetical protein